jgi:exodeoxyribonuclease VII large subunit
LTAESLTVSQVLSLAKEAIEEGIGRVWVEGELSGFKRHLPSGHLYFDMKDGRSRISCVMWRGRGRELRFEPADGMQVRARGRLGIYEVQGRLQLYVDSLQPAGLGELQAALERLKAKLDAEGLFAAERRRPLPSYPERIGVVTSPAGAAVRDILRVLGERWPVAEIILHPCAVQGEGAAASIAAAMAVLAEIPDLDLVILGRGGGSIEDLWAFNEEEVVRAIAACPVPVVTGIGHEVDFTLSDLAADIRAATPSQAAELSVPARSDLDRLLHTSAKRLRHHADGCLSTARLRLSRAERSHGLRRPVDLVRTRVQRLDDLNQRILSRLALDVAVRRRRLTELADRWKAQDPWMSLSRSRGRLDELEQRGNRAVTRWMRGAREKLRARSEHLAAIGPRSVLSRGYAICLTGEGRHVVRRFDEVEPGSRVEVVLGVGGLGCTVEECREEEKVEGSG